MTQRGRPVIQVRFEPEVIELLRQQAGHHERGRGGGLSQAVRDIVYEHFGLGAAPIFGTPPPAPEGTAGDALTRAQDLREAGFSLRQIAESLALEGYPTVHGGRWHGETVRQLLAKQPQAPRSQRRQPRR